MTPPTTHIGRCKVGEALAQAADGLPEECSLVMVVTRGEWEFTAVDANGDEVGGCYDFEEGDDPSRVIDKLCDWATGDPDEHD